MKIASITAVPVRFSSEPRTLRSHLVSPTSIFPEERSWFGPCSTVVVEVHTDDGRTGIGTAGGFSPAPATLIEAHLAPLLEGEDPSRIEYLWDKMYRSLARLGHTGTSLAAISAVDIALWDLKGKVLETPLFNLIGGLQKERIRVYASRLYAYRDLGRLAEEAREYCRQGLTFLKQRFGFGPADGREGMERNAELVRTVREAVGDRVELAADAYMGWNLSYTLEMEERLQEYRLSWIEEPLQPHDLEGYRQLSRRSRIPIAAGEHLYTRWGVKPFLERNALSLLQPDANRTGGISEMLKICGLAAACGIPVAPHSNEAHNLHIVASQAVCPFLEYFPDVEPDTGNEIFWKLFRGEPQARDGHVVPSPRPGLGIEIDRAALEELRW